jgi:hypothetical protein
VLAVLGASIKPHLGFLALAGVGAACGWRLDRRVWGGLALGLALVAGAALLAGGPGGITAWLAAPLTFSSSGDVAQQIDLLTLPSLVATVLPPAGARLVMIGSAALWAVGLVGAWRRLHGGTLAWLAVACTSWLVCAPYAHTPDLVLAVPALWLLWLRAAQSRRDLILLALGYAALWGTAPVHAAAAYGTPLGQGIDLLGALILCAVVCSSVRTRCASRPFARPVYAIRDTV